MRLMQWMAKMMAGVIVIAGLTLYFTWMTVHTYLDGVLTHYQLNVPAEKTKFSNFLLKMTGSMNIMNKIENPDKGNVLTQTPTENGPANKTSNSGNMTEAIYPQNPINGGSESVRGTSNNAADERKGESEQDASVGGDEAAPVWSQKTGSMKDTSINHDNDTQGNSGYNLRQKEAKQSLVMSAQEFDRKKALMNNEDKTAVFNLLAGNLPVEALQRITGQIENGISAEEAASFQTLIEKYLKKEQINQLMGILVKYE